MKDKDVHDKVLDPIVKMLLWYAKRMQMEDIARRMVMEEFGPIRGRFYLWCNGHPRFRGIAKRAIHKRGMKLSQVVNRYQAGER